MKTRILSQLECFATSETLAKESPVFIDIAQQCAIPTRALHIRAKNTHRYILHHFGKLNVATIDKLTHQIIRTFARDLGINPRFEVLLEAKPFMAEVVERVLSKAGEDKDLTETLLTHVVQKTDALKAWDLSLIHISEPTRRP